MSVQLDTVRAMNDTRRNLGDRGEHEALEVYLRRGYRLVARNWRCRIGELDLVLRRDDLLVFCEVKTRRGPSFGSGWEAVTPRKQAKIRAVAQAFLMHAGATDPTIRFDVASVEVGDRGGGPGRSGRVEVELFEDAF
jgi:putative endonuclease